MKRSLIVLISALTLVVLMALLTGCTSECDHKFSDEWTSDEATHYHKCTNEGCDAKKDAEAHVWGDAVTTKEPTCTEYGIATRTCIVCEATMDEPVAKKMHEYKDTYDFDDNNHWRQCKNCDSRLTFNHDFKVPGYDAESHWNSCECGAKGNVEAHTWDEGFTNPNATVTYTCTNSACKASVTGADPNHSHNWKDGEIIQQPTCTVPGVQALTCACGGESSKSIPVIAHSFSAGEYQKNDNYHWHRCECGANPTDADKIPHDFGTEYTVVGEYKVDTCVCGQEKKEIQQGYIDPDGWT